MKKEKYIDENKIILQIVNDVKKDFENRQAKRKSYERQWQLNINFLMGNQYCAITELGEVEEFGKQYFWQEREVYNHIAPIVEARISKLCAIKPKISVVPASSNENDVNTAKISKNIINSIYSKLKLSEKIQLATNWSEICGTSFYKVIWNDNSGTTVGFNNENYEIKDGEVDITVCPPYEIYPDNNNIENLQDCLSIIHAKVYDVKTIKSKYNVDVEPQDVEVMRFENGNTLGGLGYTANNSKVVTQKAENSALVIERYEAPTEEFPNGRVIIVAGDKLLYIGELPFENGVDGKRSFPFIKQCSMLTLNCFWGTSVIERLIPIQRAYNAVKNRKHEFLNRMALGILTVEDGSVDTDNLEEEGLSPGKVLIYRQGATPPQIMDYASMPSDFADEEEKLLNEFTIISGVSDMLINNTIKASAISGTALEIINEQETQRLNSSLCQIECAIIELGTQILRLYKQFVNTNRLSRLINDNGSIEMFYWNASNISTDDIVVETSTDLGESIAQRRNMIFKLLENKLLCDKNGEISNRMRTKTLEMLGFGTWENRNDLTELHIKRASKENFKMINNEQVEVLQVDDHELHIDEHTAFIIGEEFEKIENPKIKEMFVQHIMQHKNELNKTK